MSRQLLSALFCALCCACTSNGQLTVDGLGDIATAESIEVRALQGVSCDAFEEAASALEALPFSTLYASRDENLTGSLPAQRHVVAVVVFDEACTIVGYGCGVAEPGNDLRVTVTEMDVPELCACAPEGGVCRSNVRAPDGGVDAGAADAGPDSAGSPDASPDSGVPCLPTSASNCPMPPSAGEDLDVDGIRDEEECGDFTCCPDFDGDGFPDYCDVDSDGDGARDVEECGGAACPTRLDPASIVCSVDGPKVELSTQERCGSCTTRCQGTQLTPLCLDRGRALRSGFCGARGFPTVQSFVRPSEEMSETEGFELSLMAIDLSDERLPGMRVGVPDVVASTGGGAATGYVSDAMLFDALEEAEEAGFGACEGELGLPDCLYAFALRVVSIDATLEPRCAVSDEYILFASDGLGDGEYSTSRGRVRAFPGWAVYRRANVLSSYEHFPFPLLRMKIAVGNGDTTCRPPDGYVF